MVSTQLYVCHVLHSLRHAPRVAYCGVRNGCSARIFHRLAPYLIHFSTFVNADDMLTRSAVSTRRMPHCLLLARDPEFPLWYISREYIGAPNMTKSTLQFTLSSSMMHNK